eukprot:CAMPEP_0181329310 /NCGR_PEP_ID=MMETSP1101-20121128/23235_1 /TAXON_ID=46948 /ORGANISM="Rhodomonas abbreviata, Strain Caron Lab Isolate" /LENGTH=118 /DNA_ID=CAMNT_0023438365 /DNA_START=249 /DNA_END=605 /DNA_ORIENTATION=+
MPQDACAKQEPEQLDGHIQPQEGVVWRSSILRQSHPAGFAHRMLQHGSDSTSFHRRLRWETTEHDPAFMPLSNSSPVHRKPKEQRRFGWRRGKGENRRDEEMDDAGWSPSSIASVRPI